MPDYALATTLYTFAQVANGFFAWPSNQGEADYIQQMAPGDFIIPKFAQTTSYEESGDDAVQRAYCQAIGDDYDQLVALYDETIASGAAAVPYILRVTSTWQEDSRYAGVPWARVSVDRESLARPLSTRDFLLLRALPTTVAAQFKGIVSRGRHLQEVPHDLVVAVRAAGATDSKADYLRRYSLVEAGDASSGVTALESAGLPVVAGDRAFLAASGGLPGLHEALQDGALEPISLPIPKTLDELLELFEDAAARATSQDRFSATAPLHAVEDLQALLNGPSDVVPVDDFGRFHDRYVLFSNKVTQALEIAQRPFIPSDQTPAEKPGDEEQGGSDIDEMIALQALTVEDVERALPEGMQLPRSVLAEAVTALRSGKHLLLGGPPGTGKTTLAEALCRAVMTANYDMTTGTADWTTFDTIGGYLPSSDGLEFMPGVVLRALRRGRWLIIDELNRADIDKAFGPLFTLLSSSASDSAAARRSVLPYTEDGRPVEVEWSEDRQDASTPYVLTPGWRMIGTLNLADKASLYRLSFAFLRRFAVIDVPLPEREQYEALFRKAIQDVALDDADAFVRAGMAVAYGPVPIGPAILVDVAGYLSKGLAVTATGEAAYEDPETAFLDAVRLLAVPQYEGALPPLGDRLVASLKAVWPEVPDASFEALGGSLRAVSLH